MWGALVMKRSRLMMVTFLGPAIFTFLLVYLYPTIRTAYMSFFYVKNVTDKFSKWEYVGFDNYNRLSQSTLFRTSLGNIAYIWLVGGIIVLLSALLYAIVLTSGTRFKSFFRSVIYLPNIISFVALGTMWIHYVYNPEYGLFKKAFGLVGLKALSEFQWTAPDSLLMSLTIAYSFGMIGYFMLIFMAGIEKIPIDFYEAATIEGAGIFKKFFAITMPLMRDVFKTTITLWSVNALGFFVWSQVFSPLNPENGTVTPLVYMYNTVFGKNFIVGDPKLINAGAGSAVGVILTVLTLVVFAAVNLIIKDRKIEY